VISAGETHVMVKCKYCMHFTRILACGDYAWKTYEPRRRHKYLSCFVSGLTALTQQTQPLNCCF